MTPLESFNFFHAGPSTYIPKENNESHPGVLFSRCRAVSLTAQHNEKSELCLHLKQAAPVPECKRVNTGVGGVYLAAACTCVKPLRLRSQPTWWESAPPVADSAGEPRRNSAVIYQRGIAAVPRLRQLLMSRIRITVSRHV